MHSDSNIGLGAWEQLLSPTVSWSLCPNTLLDILQPRELTGGWNGLSQNLHLFIDPFHFLEPMALVWWYLNLACSLWAPSSY